MRWINDCIHGMIQLPDFIDRVVRTPIFQRLDRVRQLGNLHLAWPSATHTRYEHSLGTMHLALEYSRVLEFSPVETRVFSLASLLHDIGHGPFSHTFEQAIHGTPTQEEFVDHDHYRVFLLENNTALSTAVSDVGPEIMAVWNDVPFLGSKIDPPMIHVMHALLAGVAGVDRLDYIARDSYHTTPQRRIDRTLVQTIMANTEICRDKGRVTYTRKGTTAVEHFLDERTYLYREVYFHRRAIEADRHLSRAFGPDMQQLLHPLVVDADAFERLDDAFVIQQAWNPVIATSHIIRDVLRDTIPKIQHSDDGPIRICKQSMADEDLVHVYFERPIVPPKDVCVAFQEA